jgi:hypothetical protein
VLEQFVFEFSFAEDGRGFMELTSSKGGASARSAVATAAERDAASMPGLKKQACNMVRCAPALRVRCAACVLAR